MAQILIFFFLQKGSNLNIKAARVVFLICNVSSHYDKLSTRFHQNIPKESGNYGPDKNFYQEEETKNLKQLEWF